MTGQLGHQAISASAGSGKTFQLAHRYLRLLASGAMPEEIVALTFSRKAAGEIFDSIVAYLCNAASSGEAASRLGTQLNRPGLTPAEATEILRRLFDSLHRLRVGTLDSFTAAILRCFPLELGIPPSFEMMDSEGAAATTVQQSILDKIFRLGTGSDNRTRRDFVSAFQQASLGRRNKQVEENLAAFISRYQAHIRALPDPGLWGHKEAIWPCGTPWMDGSTDVGQSATELRRALSELNLAEDAATRWDAFIAAAKNYGINSGWTHDIKYLFEKLCLCISDLREGSATVKLNRTKYNLTGDVARHVLSLTTHLIRTDIEAALARTQGIYRMLAIYEQQYDEAMRRDGRISFTDAQYLLTGSNTLSGGARLTSVDGEDNRLYIDYRLDARLNHWLLDEFQDTSDLQWEVLSNLVDEVLQDGSGHRTFFYVGDVKQAIYGWRGGNPRLFDVPLNRYPGQIEMVPLTKSFRSCQPVMDMVNRIFDNLAESSIPDHTVNWWNRFWQTHECAHGHVPQRGYAAVIEPPCDSGNLTPGTEDRYRVVVRLLQEIDPLRRGLSTAILVRSNQQGKTLVNYLRQNLPGSVIIHEGRAAIKDNPVVAVLLSLISCAAHPGDLFAWRHLQMSPLGAVLLDLGLDRDSLTLLVLRQVQTEGFQSTLRDWSGRLDKAHPLDEFGRLRVEQLLTAAGEYDRGGSSDCNQFLSHIDRYEFHDTGARDVIRVMTVHQAKGLGFDIVVLPELDKHNMLQTRDLNFILSRDASTQEPRWALEIPRRAVAECDETLRAEIEEADANTTFESLCLLYVAMTRARRGLYIVTSFPGKTASAFNQATLIKERLVGNMKATEKDGRPLNLGGEVFTCLYPVTGVDADERWFDEFPIRPTPAPSIEPAPATIGLAHRRSYRAGLVAIRPSDSEMIEESAAELFSPERRRRLDAGIAVHELMRKVTWEDEVNVKSVTTQWSRETTADEDVRRSALDHFDHAMKLPGLRNVLRHPGGNATLWRERRFDVVLGNRWITGSFDRVVIQMDANDTPQSATIYDFKTDDVPAKAVATRAELYRSQMEIYRVALQRILSLAAPLIHTVLVFTTTGITHELSAVRTATDH